MPRRILHMLLVLRMQPQPRHPNHRTPNHRIPPEDPNAQLLPHPPQTAIRRFNRHRQRGLTPLRAPEVRALRPRRPNEPAPARQHLARELPADLVVRVLAPYGQALVLVHVGREEEVVEFVQEGGGDFGAGAAEAVAEGGRGEHVYAVVVGR